MRTLSRVAGRPAPDPGCPRGEDGPDGQQAAETGRHGEGAGLPLLAATILCSHGLTVPARLPAGKGRSARFLMALVLGCPGRHIDCGLRRTRSRRNGEVTHSYPPAFAARRIATRSSIISAATPASMARSLAAARLPAWIWKPICGSWGGRSSPPGVSARRAGRPRQALHGPARYAGPFHHLVQQAPVRLEGTQVRKRSRRRAGQRLVCDDPASRAQQVRDPAQGPTGSAWCIKNARVKARSNGPPSVVASRSPARRWGRTRSRSPSIPGRRLPCAAHAGHAP